MLAGKPEGEIENDAGIKARFAHAEKASQNGKLSYRLYKSGQDGDNPPTDENPCNPLSGTDLVHDDVAGYFKEEVGYEKNPGNHPKGTGADAQFLVHLQGGKSHINPVQHGYRSEEHTSELQSR